MPDRAASEGHTPACLAQTELVPKQGLGGPVLHPSVFPTPRHLLRNGSYRHAPQGAQYDISHTVPLASRDGCTNGSPEKTSHFPKITQPVKGPPSDGWLSHYKGVPALPPSRVGLALRSERKKISGALGKIGASGIGPGYSWVSPLTRRSVHTWDKRLGVSSC